MANADIEVKVILEQSAHAALKSAIQDIYESYGLMISSIGADWIIGNQLSEQPTAKITEVRLHTKTLY